MKTPRLFIYFTCFSLFLAACSPGPAAPEQDPSALRRQQNDSLAARAKQNTLSTPAAIRGNYTGTFYKGNYVWAAAMNLAWNQMASSLGKTSLDFDTRDTTALALARKFNHPVITRDDLDPASCFISTGQGQDGLNQLKNGWQNKFPQHTLEFPASAAEENEIICFAYLFKQLTWSWPFTKNNKFKFNGEQVEGFDAGAENQKSNVRIYSYHHDDKFIIGIRTKEKNDEIILAKGYDMNSPEQVLEACRQTGWKWTSVMKPDDRFAAPCLSLEHTRDYSELVGNWLLSPQPQEFLLNMMREQIKFKMDETGAVLENSAVMKTAVGAMMERPKVTPKYLLLNKPFWVLLKQANSQNPYFLLGVTNTELMTLTDQ